MTFWSNGIQALQYRWKKHVDRKDNYVEKLASFGRIPWKYLVQTINFLVNLCK